MNPRLKQQLIETIGETQDGGARTLLKRFKDRDEGSADYALRVGDAVTDIILTSVQDADDIERVVTNLEYARSQVDLAIAAIRQKTGRREFLEKQLAEQEQWIKDCGGDLAGYIERYGDPGKPKKGGSYMSGDGGTAIYNADIAELNRIKNLLRGCALRV